MATYSIDLRVTAPVKDTEVPARVAEAVQTLFPAADVSVDDDRVVATGHAVEHFAERLREQRILDTARSTLAGGRHGDTFAVDLKKQAALQDVVNFAVGNPDELGDVRVEIRVHEPDPDEFLDWIAPETDDEGDPPAWHGSSDEDD